MPTAPRGVAIRLNGRPATDTPRPVLSPRAAGTWSDLGPYEVFQPGLDARAVHDLHDDDPGRTVAVAPPHARHEPRRSPSPSPAPGSPRCRRRSHGWATCPTRLHGFVGASSVAPLTRAQAAQRAYEPAARGCCAPNVHGAPPLDDGHRRRDDDGRDGGLRGRPRAAAVDDADAGSCGSSCSPPRRSRHRDPQPVHVGRPSPRRSPRRSRSTRAPGSRCRSPTNTGVPGAATQQGIFPIYVRFVATTMIGTNVDGSHYDDPGVPWVNYFNGGDAVHGYIRPGYGYPQSNGCVELPIATAADGLRHAGSSAISSSSSDRPARRRDGRRRHAGALASPGCPGRARRSAPLRQRLRRARGIAAATAGRPSAAESRAGDGTRRHAPAARAAACSAAGEPTRAQPSTAPRSRCCGGAAVEVRVGGRGHAALAAAVRGHLRPQAGAPPAEVRGVCRSRRAWRRRPDRPRGRGSRDRRSRAPRRGSQRDHQPDQLEQDERDDAREHDHPQRRLSLPAQQRRRCRRLEEAREVGQAVVDRSCSGRRASRPAGRRRARRCRACRSPRACRRPCGTATRG